MPPRTMTIEIDGLTKLDQLSLEKSLDRSTLTFRAEAAPTGSIGYVPLLTMIAQFSPELLAVVTAALAAWFATARHKESLDVTMSTEKPDGTKVTVSMKARRTDTEPMNLETELVKLGETLLAKK